MRRIVQHQVPPKVGYGLTDRGQSPLSGPRRDAEVGGDAMSLMVLLRRNTELPLDSIPMGGFPREPAQNVRSDLS